MLETKHFKNIRVIQRYLTYVMVQIEKLEKREIRTGKSKSEVLKSRDHVRVRGMITNEQTDKHKINTSCLN